MKGEKLSREIGAVRFRDCVIGAAPFEAFALKLAGAGDATKTISGSVKIHRGRRRRRASRPAGHVSETACAQSRRRLIAF